MERLNLNKQNFSSTSLPKTFNKFSLSHEVTKDSLKESFISNAQKQGNTTSLKETKWQEMMRRARECEQLDPSLPYDFYLSEMIGGAPEEIQGHPNYFYGKLRKRKSKNFKIKVPKGPRTKIKTLVIPKWRSVEPTSIITRDLYPSIADEVVPDVDDEGYFVPVIPRAPELDRLPPYYLALDVLEMTIRQMSNPGTVDRERLFLCLDFDTPLDIPMTLRISESKLDYFSRALLAIAKAYENCMPSHLYRNMIHRHIELTAAKQAKHTIKQKRIVFNTIKRYTQYFFKWIARYSFEFLFDYRLHPAVEATSNIVNVLEGTAAGIFAGYKFYQAGAGNKDDPLGRFILNWSMQGISVIRSGKFLDWVLWLLSFINIFTPLTEIASYVFDLLKKLLAKLPSLGFSSPQVTTGPAVEPTSLSDVFDAAADTFSSVLSNTGTIAAVLSVFVVVVSSILLGTNLKDVRMAESLGEKFVKSGVAVAKGKSGIYAAISMVGDLKPWIESAMCSMSLMKLDDNFSKAILTADIDDTEDLRKEKIFEHVEFLTNPINFHKINQSHPEQIKLTWAHSVLSRVLENNAKNSVLTPAATQLLSRQIAELNKVRTSVFRYVKDEDTRFVPFWINIYGLAGTRKSTFMSKLAKTLVEALRRLGKYEVNGNDNIYAVNFTDKYMTGYKQEMCVLIDDIFQDASPVGDRSSALDIISWVSNIPHHTNQAALDDKGLPFTSKIIISTTNVPPCALSRKEIMCDDALKRRMKVAIEFEKDLSAPIDPILGEHIKIYRVDPLGDVNSKQPIQSAQALCSLILREYIAWYDLQQKLISTGGADDDCVTQMIKELDPEGKIFKPEIPKQIISNTPLAENPIPQTSSELQWYDSKKQEIPNKLVSVEATSLTSWWAAICQSVGGSPRFTHKQGVSQFDEKYHPNMATFNMVYYNYVTVQCTFTGEEPIPILMYKKAWDEKQEEMLSANEQVTNGKLWLDRLVKTVKETPLWAWLGLGIAGIVAYKWYTSSSPPEATAVKYDYGKPARKPAKVAKIVTPTSGVMDAYRDDFTVTGTDANAMDLVLTSLIGRGGISRLLVPLDEKRAETAVCTRIGGTTILANHHVFVKMAEGAEFTVEIPHYANAMKSVKQKFDPRRLARIGKTDACVYKCDASMPCAKDIVRHFSKDDIKVKSSNAVIATRNPEAMYVSNVIATPVTKPETYTDDEKKEEYSTVGGYEVTNYTTTKGMSGSLLVALDPYNPRKLLGIQTSRHVHSKVGYFQPITETQLRVELKKIGEDLASTPVNEEMVAEACSVIMDNHCPPNLGKGSLMYIGTLDKDSQVQQQKKTKLCPSLIQDEKTLVKAPAALDKYDQRLDDEVYGKDLMYKNMEGFDTAQYGSLNLPVLDQVTEMMAAEYACVRTVPGIPKRLLTTEEMVNGIQGIINPIDMTTSPGYPYVKQRVQTGVNGKYEWFIEHIEDDGRKTYTPRYDFMEHIMHRESTAKNGLRIGSIAYSCLKDETRPLARVSKGITRAFICLPMDYNLLIRKYFGMYTATQHALAGRISSSVGIDPVTGWKGLYDRLRSKGDLWEDFDYKNWDQFLHPEFIKRYASIVNTWYGDKDDSPNGKVRHVLMQELAFTYLIVGKKLFMKTGGQCSGCAITAEINCDIHDIIMFYVFCCMVHDQKINTGSNEDLLTFYRENVELALYGDDIVKSATQAVTKWFNGKTIAPYMTQMGMKITPADKESTDFVIKKPEEVTFLKRSFKPDSEYPDRFIRAPLDLKTIWNIPQWIKQSDDNQGATRVNCEMALREMYMYGEEHFNNAKDKLNTRIAAYNMQHPGAEIRPLTMTYSVLSKAYEEGSLEICYPKGWLGFAGEPLVQ